MGVWVGGSLDTLEEGLTSREAVGPTIPGYASGSGSVVLVEGQLFFFVHLLVQESVSVP